MAWPTEQHFQTILTKAQRFLSEFQLKRFDNSRDTLAIQLQYGKNWKQYLQMEVPHQHDELGNVTLTNSFMTFELFVTWLEKNLGHE